MERDCRHGVVQWRWNKIFNSDLLLFHFWVCPDFKMLELYFSSGKSEFFRTIYILVSKVVYQPLQNDDLLA